MPKRVQTTFSGIRHFRPLSSSPLPYTVFAPTLFEFDLTKSSSPPDESCLNLVAIKQFLSAAIWIVSNKRGRKFLGALD